MVVLARVCKRSRDAAYASVQPKPPSDQLRRRLSRAPRRSYTNLTALDLSVREMTWRCPPTIRPLTVDTLLNEADLPLAALASLTHSGVPPSRCHVRSVANLSTNSLAFAP